MKVAHRLDWSGRTQQKGDHLMLMTYDRLPASLANDADDITAFFAEFDDATVAEILAVTA